VGSCFERDRQGLGSAQDSTLQVAYPPLGSAKVWQTREELFQRDSALEPRKSGAEAVVDPKAKGHVVLWGSVQVELVAAGKLA